jgi:hypothetical protein
MKRIAVPAVAVIASLSLVARWRPITAVTAPDQGNPDTTAERNWVPLPNTANGLSYLGVTPRSARRARHDLSDGERAGRMNRGGSVISSSTTRSRLIAEPSPRAAAAEALD